MLFLTSLEFFIAWVYSTVNLFFFSHDKNSIHKKYGKIFQLTRYWFFKRKMMMPRKLQDRDSCCRQTHLNSSNGQDYSLIILFIFTKNQTLTEKKKSHEVINRRIEICLSSKLESSPQTDHMNKQSLISKSYMLLR